ncbi:unnamed protein product [Pylaiella littoralis]
MRKPSCTPLSPARLQRLLAWLCCQYLAVASATAAVDALGTGIIECRSDSYITIAETRFTAGGCYQKTDQRDNNDDALYIRVDPKAAGVEERVKRQAIFVNGEHVSPDGERGEPRWAIRQMVTHSGTLVCRNTSGQAAERSSALVQRWECADKYQTKPTVFTEELVTCGCAAPDQDDFETDAGSIRFPGSSSGSSRTDGVGVRFVGTNIRGSSRGFPGPREGAMLSRALESVTGEFDGFWMWVIIAGGIAGLIVLCCVGWYIRNPFFCQKPPPENPEIQVLDDAAPHAPKTAFQPWGASVPPM